MMVQRKPMGLGIGALRVCMPKLWVRIVGLPAIAVLALFLPLAPASLSFVSPAYANEGGDGGGGDGGGGDRAKVERNDPSTAPAGYKKLELIPWLAGDWQKDGASESKMRSMISRVGEIGSLLPSRGRPGQTWNKATAPRWNDAYAIKWHQKSILFQNRPQAVTKRNLSSAPSQTSSRTQPTPGPTPAVGRKPPPPNRAEVEKMMARGYLTLKRDQGLLQASQAEANAVFYDHVKKGLEGVQTTAETVFTVAGIFAGGGAVVGTVKVGAAVGTAAAHGYLRYHEVKLRGGSTDAAMKAAGALSGGELAFNAIGGAGKTAVSKLAVRNMMKNAVLGEKALTQAGKPIEAAVKRMDVELGTLEAVAGYEANNLWSKTALTGGAP